MRSDHHVRKQLDAAARPFRARARTREQQSALIRSGAWDLTTVAERLEVHAALQPDATAVIDCEGARERTFAQLNADADLVAADLRERGVCLGDVVSIQLPNWYEAVAIAIGVLKAGGILNPLLPIYRKNELTHMLGVTEAKLLITPRSYRGCDYAPLVDGVLRERPLPTGHLVVDAPEPDRSPFLETIRDRPTERRRLDLDPLRVSMIAFSSGTEAAPKAIMHTEQTTGFNVRAIAASLAMGASDVVWLPAPIGHSTGFNRGARLAIHLGIPLVMQDRWDPGVGAHLIERFGCTYSAATPTFLRDMLDAPHASRNLTTLRLFATGGTPVAPDLVESAAARGVTVLRLFGATETLVATCNRPESSWTQRLHTDGPPLEGVTIQTRDDAGSEVSGAPGEVFVNSPGASVGLVGDAARSEAIFTEGGWVATGDIGVIDADGHLTIVGRRKDIIIRGGMNIAPREVEELVVQVAAVRAAAVIGIPDHRLGERTCVCVELHDGMSLGLEELVGSLRTLGLAAYKLPEELVILDRLPTNALGKVAKAELLRHATTRLGLTRRDDTETQRRATAVGRR
jgi:acyl-CoA synthetase (AMP-forming)/AMP-acid ligase II